LTAQLLDLCTPAQREALEVCVAVGYWHPRLGTETVRPAELRPWGGAFGARLGVASPDLEAAAEAGTDTAAKCVPRCP
jgi:hypothetical protein